MHPKQSALVPSAPAVAVRSRAARGIRAPLSVALVSLVAAACGTATSDETSARSSEAITPVSTPAILPLTGGAAGGCTPTTANMTNTGPGVVMHAIQAHLIFWLPPGIHFEAGGNAASDARYESLMAAFVSDIGSTPLFQMLSQYPDATGAAPSSVTLAGTWTDTTPYPSAGTTSQPILDSSYQVEIQNVIAAPSGPQWPVTNNDFFIVFTGTGINSCFTSAQTNCTFNSGVPGNQAYGAYHSQGQYNGGGQYNQATFAYANMPAAASIGYYANAPAYPNDPLADPTIAALAHELFEAATDPFLNAWKGPAGNCDEIGDKCNLNFGNAVNFDGSNLLIGNGDRYIVQQEWSNAAATAGGPSAGCTLVVPAPSAPNASLSSTCSAEDFPVYNPNGYYQLETVTVSPRTTLSVVQQRVGSNWVSLQPWSASAGSPPGTTTEIYDVGSTLGTTVSSPFVGATAGSIQAFRACTITTGGTACDPQTNLQIEACPTSGTSGPSCSSGTCSAGYHWNAASCGCVQNSSTCTTSKCLCEARGGCTWTGKLCECE